MVRAGVRVGRALVRVRALIKMKTRPRFGSGKEGWWWWREEAENSKTSRLASFTLVPFPRETIIITCVYTRFRRFVFVSRTAPHRHTIACNNTTVTRISYGVQKKYLPPPPSRRNFVRSGSTLSINEKLSFSSSRLLSVTFGRCLLMIFLRNIINDDWSLRNT